MDVNEETIDKDENIQINIEQICAAILTQLESIEIPINVLLSDYSNKLIAVNQDDENKSLTFTLIDSESVENQAETE
jgi:hypothetical protein